MDGICRPIINLSLKRADGRVCACTYGRSPLCISAGRGPSPVGCIERADRCRRRAAHRRRLLVWPHTPIQRGRCTEVAGRGARTEARGGRGGHRKLDVIAAVGALALDHERQILRRVGPLVNFAVRDRNSASFCGPFVALSLEGVVFSLSGADIGIVCPVGHSCASRAALHPRLLCFGLDLLGARDLLDSA